MKTIRVIDHYLLEAILPYGGIWTPLFVVLAAIYFTRGLDPKDILEPAMRMNPH